ERGGGVGGGGGGGKVGGGEARGPGGRGSAAVHLRRQRSASRGRAAAGGGAVPQSLPRAVKDGRRAAAIFGQAQGSGGSGAEAEDHRPRVHRRLRGGGERIPGCPIPGARNAVSRRDRIRILQGPERHHQEPSQRGRPAGGDEAQAGGAFARAVQG